MLVKLKIKIIYNNQKKIYSKKFMNYFICKMKLIIFMSLCLFILLESTMILKILLWTYLMKLKKNSNKLKMKKIFLKRNWCLKELFKVNKN